MPARFLFCAAALLAAPTAADLADICGWQAHGLGNPLVLAPAECPPWVCPEPTPCSCCVSGAQFGLGVFNTPPFSGAIVFFSLGVAEFPLFGQTAFIAPAPIVATVALPADPVVSDFANVCWNQEDCLTIPADPALIGLRIQMQAAAPDATHPDGWLLSNRLELKIGTLF